MKLQQLRYLIQIAESGSFTKAATKLNIAQPALSKQIRMLESDLGVALFIRDGRGVEPTAAGRELVQRASTLFNDLYEMRQSIASYREVVEGKVTIGMMPMLGAHVVPDLLLRARQMHPNVQINFMVGMSHAIHEWVISGRADFGLVSTSSETSTYLVYKPLAHDRMEFVTSASDTSIEDGNVVTLAEAALHPLVIPTRANGLRTLIDNSAASKGLTLQPVIEVDSIDIIKRLVRTGIGKSILPKFSIIEEVERGEFRSAPVVEPGMTYEAAITFPAERPLSTISAAVASILQEVVLSVMGQTATNDAIDYS
jgi:LysR family nitrogen assimilation transcriptional regulator